MDGVCTLRGRHAQRGLKIEFEAPIHPGNAQRTLHRLGKSCLKLRSRRTEHNSQAQQTFRKHAPLPASSAGEVRGPLSDRVRGLIVDWARLGGSRPDTLINIWAGKGL